MESDLSFRVQDIQNNSYNFKCSEHITNKQTSQPHQKASCHSIKSSPNMRSCWCWVIQSHWPSTCTNMRPLSSTPHMLPWSPPIKTNTVSLPDSPIATLGQGPLACSCDAPSLLQLHKRKQRAFNWLQCIPIGGGIWRSGKHRIGPCRQQLKAMWASIPIG